MGRLNGYVSVTASKEHLAWLRIDLNILENTFSLWIPNGSYTTNVKFPRRSVMWQGSFEIHCGCHPIYSVLFMTFHCQIHFMIPNLAPCVHWKEATCWFFSVYFRLSEDTSRNGLRERSLHLVLSAVVYSWWSSIQHFVILSLIQILILINLAWS